MTSYNFDIVVEVPEGKKLRVFGTIKRWEEIHPYGSTYASEFMEEVDDLTFELDNKDISYNDLIDIHGWQKVEEWIKFAVDRADY